MVENKSLSVGHVVIIATLKQLSHREDHQEQQQQAQDHHPLQMAQDGV